MQATHGAEICDKPKKSNKFDFHFEKLDNGRGYLKTVKTSNDSQDTSNQVKELELKLKDESDES